MAAAIAIPETRSGQGQGRGCVHQAGSPVFVRQFKAFELAAVLNGVPGGTLSTLPRRAANFPPPIVISGGTLHGRG